MCGRYSFTSDLVTFITLFKIDITSLKHQPRYNIAPSQLVPVVVLQEGKRVAKDMKWGLIPAWSKNPAVGYKMINARFETINEKASYKYAFRKQRCLIPADGFYEWKEEGNKKQPYRFVLPNHGIFALAGIWDRWQSPEGKEILSFSIITTDANQLVQNIHHRMPAILVSEESQRQWLESDNLEQLYDLLKPYQGELAMYPVTHSINSPQADDSLLIERLEHIEQIRFEF